MDYKNAVKARQVTADNAESKMKDVNSAAAASEAAVPLQTAMRAAEATVMAREAVFRQEEASRGEAASTAQRAQELLEAWGGEDAPEARAEAEKAWTLSTTAARTATEALERMRAAETAFLIAEAAVGDAQHNIDALLGVWPVHNRAAAAAMAPTAQCLAAAKHLMAVAIVIKMCASKPRPPTAKVALEARKAVLAMVEQADQQHADSARAMTLLMEWSREMKRLFGEATATGTCTNCADQTPLAEHCLLCAPCLKQYGREVYIKPLLKSMKFRRKKWKDDGDPRGDEGFDITLESMHTERCALTGMPMATAPCSHWQMSPERRNEARGYTTDNVCYVILELNHANQMTPAKVDFAFTSFSGYQPYEVCELDCAPSPRPQAVRMPILQWGNPPEARFGARVQDLHCSHADGDQQDLAGCPLNHPHQCEAQRQATCKKRGGLVLDQLIAKLQGQRGLCYYSDMRMYSRKGDWRVSLERLNSALGYTDANTVLVCQKFNVTDRSASRHAPPTAGGVWSRAKVETVRTFMKNARMQRGLDVNGTA
ncbi:hypothetical protein JKP88DRAFT_268832 [Tribonema minus]|uniref:Uncharacterized protein n=1 Tax=Tribonema minus TaxID=303371 RepID=A0A836CDF4_9STRA|nr:hypothetical protein JKP88DRAFT_268832 [Tribonema minus]